MSASEVERARRECMEAIVAGLHRCGVNARLESLESTALDALEAAVRAEEREACARVADSVCASDPDVIAGEFGHPPCCHAHDIAAAIRARGTA